ncbi:M6 family metalloprotease domain protein, partial [Vibrio parahaemolyticus V-223/04]
TSSQRAVKRTRYPDVFFIAF